MRWVATGRCVVAVMATIGALLSTLLTVPHIAHLREPVAFAADRPRPTPARREKIHLRSLQFAEGKAEISEADHALLDVAVQSLKQTPADVIVVVGHSDAEELKAHGRDLSLERAKAVRDYLIKAGVDDYRVAAAASLDRQPVASNATAEGRSRNRRVTLRLFRGD